MDLDGDDYGADGLFAGDDDGEEGVPAEQGGGGEETSEVKDADGDGEHQKGFEDGGGAAAASGGGGRERVEVEDSDDDAGGPLGKGAEDEDEDDDLFGPGDENEDSRKKKRRKGEKEKKQKKDKKKRKEKSGEGGAAAAAAAGKGGGEDGDLGGWLVNDGEAEDPDEHIPVEGGIFSDRDGDSSDSGDEGRRMEEPAKVSEFDIACEKVKARKRKPKDPKQMEADRAEDWVQENLIGRMVRAAEKDDQAFRQQMPALHKLSLLKGEVGRELRKPKWTEHLVNKGLFSVMKRWLEPMPDGSAQALEVREGMVEILLGMPLRGAHDPLANSKVMGQVVKLLKDAPPRLTEMVERLVRKVTEQMHRVKYQEEPELAVDADDEEGFEDRDKDRKKGSKRRRGASDSGESPVPSAAAAGASFPEGVQVRRGPAAAAAATMGGAAAPYQPGAGGRRAPPRVYANAPISSFQGERTRNENGQAMRIDRLVRNFKKDSSRGRK
uniref:TFIIS N-terminal domain-containing protein n=1 Tax=Chromera velia CCMP2878 TaxID=1169474 RepID=A0A0G4FRY8_9ALVE|eukprot:Cvel_18458.t1-p1 / transcript=Cvel_18458.t1 / gene=Cvel_18458 / organism=Chromera_velia_CCMP2878 / gene_product=Protein IWS1 homolog, putative / transcript_product=Protein IWS1 homolog, putative / location=Cvel_scaffold1529:28434-31560(+) / protein_length=494 / sequence_SO=supercontig / SO=protein_coding / is_pseudo=false